MGTNHSIIYNSRNLKIGINKNHLQPGHQIYNSRNLKIGINAKTQAAAAASTIVEI